MQHVILFTDEDGTVTVLSTHQPMDSATAEFWADKVKAEYGSNSFNEIRVLPIGNVSYFLGG